LHIKENQYSTLFTNNNHGTSCWHTHSPMLGLNTQFYSHKSKLAVT
jgi:hypothetical protein